MDTSSLSQALGANLAPASTTAAATQQVSSTFDTFLKLLTSQLKNQDPLKPMDSSEFTQQLVMYSQVEQQINTNDNLQKLIDGVQSSQFATSVGYIGKSIEATGAHAGIKDGGGATWQYNLPSDAKSATLAVADANGKTVFSQSGETAAGDHSFAWDGKDATGNAMPAGVYTLTISANDPKGQPITATTSISGIVDGVETVDGVQSLLVGGQSFPVSDVTKVTATN